MLTHIVMITLKADAPGGQAEKVVAALKELPAAVPEIKELRVGTDLGLVEGNYDLALVATFESEAAYRTYSAAPPHRQLVAELVAPFVERRASIQFES